LKKHNAALFSTEPVKEPFAPDPHGASGPTPPAAQRQWVGLTDDEISILAASLGFDPHVKDVIRKAEAKLREKNQ
jgi:hypothetical protein